MNASSQELEQRENEVAGIQELAQNLSLNNSIDMPRRILEESRRYQETDDHQEAEEKSERARQLERQMVQ